MLQQVSLIGSNQEVQTTLMINDVNRSLKIVIDWNKIAGYWVMGVIDDASGNFLVDSIPLVTGLINSESLNILRAFGYLKMGKVYLVPTAKETSTDYPNQTNLNSEFALVWDDNS